MNWFFQIGLLFSIHLLCSFVALVFVVAWKNKHTPSPNRTVAKGVTEEGPEFTHTRNERERHLDRLIVYAIPKALLLGTVPFCFIAKAAGIFSIVTFKSYVFLFMIILLAALLNQRSAQRGH